MGTEPASGTWFSPENRMTSEGSQSEQGRARVLRKGYISNRDSSFGRGKKDERVTNDERLAGDAAVKPKWPP